MGQGRIPKDLMGTALSPGLGCGAGKPPMDGGLGLRTRAVFESGPQAGSVFSTDYVWLEFRQ